MKLFGININNFSQAALRLKKEDVIFWGIVGLAVLLLAFLLVGGFTFYDTATREKTVPVLERETITFSTAQIDEIIGELDERKRKFDESR